jgi:hypothetical protein
MDPPEEPLRSTSVPPQALSGGRNSCPPHTTSEGSFCRLLQPTSRRKLGDKREEETGGSQRGNKRDNGERTEGRETREGP